MDIQTKTRTLQPRQTVHPIHHSQEFMLIQTSTNSKRRQHIHIQQNKWKQWRRSHCCETTHETQTTRHLHPRNHDHWNRHTSLPYHHRHRLHIPTKTLHKRTRYVSASGTHKTNIYTGRLQWHHRFSEYTDTNAVGRGITSLIYDGIIHLGPHTPTFIRANSFITPDLVLATPLVNGDPPELLYVS